MYVRWIQWKKYGGPKPGPTPEPAPRAKDPDRIIFMCVLAAGRKEEVENQNRFFEENQVRMHFVEEPAGEKTSTSGRCGAEGGENCMLV